MCAFQADTKGHSSENGVHGHHQRLTRERILILVHFLTYRDIMDSSRLVNEEFSLPGVAHEAVAKIQASQRNLRPSVKSHIPIAEDRKVQGSICPLALSDLMMTGLMHPLGPFLGRW